MVASVERFNSDDAAGGDVVRTLIVVESDVHVSESILRGVVRHLRRRGDGRKHLSKGHRHRCS